MTFVGSGSANARMSGTFSRPLNIPHIGGVPQIALLVICAPCTVPRDQPVCSSQRLVEISHLGVPKDCHSRPRTRRSVGRNGLFHQGGPVGNRLKVNWVVEACWILNRLNIGTVDLLCYDVHQQPCRTNAHILASPAGYEHLQAWGALHSRVLIQDARGSQQGGSYEESTAIHDVGLEKNLRE